MVTPLRIAFVEWPEGLTTDGAQWSELKDSLATALPDILVTNELPYGPWLADGAAFSEDEAHLSIGAHEQGLAGLIDLRLPAVISSRPVWNGKRLANEAFVLENGVVRPLHRKQYFPNEPGWFESAWFVGDDSGFHVADVLGLSVGVLLCTEAMFNERARAYGKTKGFFDRHPSRNRRSNRAVDNCRRHGVARFRRLCRQFESRRPLQKR